MNLISFTWIYSESFWWALPFIFTGIWFRHIFRIHRHLWAFSLKLFKQFFSLQYFILNIWWLFIFGQFSSEMSVLQKLFEINQSFLFVVIHRISFSPLLLVISASLSADGILVKLLLFPYIFVDPLILSLKHLLHFIYFLFVLGSSLHVRLMKILNLHRFLKLMFSLHLILRFSKISNIAFKPIHSCFVHALILDAGSSLI